MTFCFKSELSLPSGSDKLSFFIECFERLLIEFKLLKSFNVGRFSKFKFRGLISVFSGEIFSETVSFLKYLLTIQLLLFKKERLVYFLGNQVLRFFGGHYIFSDFIITDKQCIETVLVNIVIFINLEQSPQNRVLDDSYNIQKLPRLLSILLLSILGKKFSSAFFTI